MNDINTLSHKETTELSEKHIRGFDKWYRMCAGISSQLERYTDGIIYLKIKNTERCMPSDINTARKLADCWKDNNQELKNAQAFVAIFYATVSTGFMVSHEDTLDKEKMKILLGNFNEGALNRESKLIEIFNGYFSGK